MKKIRRICLILALFLFVLWCVKEVGRETFQFPDLKKWADEWDKGKGLVDRIESQVVSQGNVYDLDEAIMFDTEREILSGSRERYPLEEAFDNLWMEASGCELSILESPDETFYAEWSHMDKIQVYVEEGALYVRTADGADRWEIYSSNTKKRLCLYVPKDYVWTNVTCSFGGGSFSLDKIACEKGTFKVGAGKLVCQDIRAQQIETEVGMGDMRISSFYTDALSAKVDLGKIELVGNVCEKARLECAVGTIAVTLKGEESDYNYEWKTVAGNVTLGDQKLSDLSKGKRIDNQSEIEIYGEVAMGDIKLSFAE